MTSADRDLLCLDLLFIYSSQLLHHVGAFSTTAAAESELWYSRERDRASDTDYLHRTEYTVQ
ncbi:MAG: hypothetical protein AB4352_21735 [Hormoscilla sp.]